MSDNKPQTIHDMANYIFSEATKRANADNFDEAIGVYNNILDIAHTVPIAYSQRGRCHWEMRRWFQAKQDFEESVRLDPTNDDYAWTLGLINLQLNKFKEGWDGYERRWGSKVFKSPRLATNKPQWKPGMEAKKVLVWCEQGLGDQIIYASLLPELQKYVEEVTVLIDARLALPLSRAMPKIKFLHHDARIKLDEHDAHIPIASLGSYFIHSLNDIPAKTARNYLRADAHRARSILKASGLENQKIIGLSWASTANVVGKHKSCALKDLEPILEWGKQNGYKFLSLQYGIPQEEMAAYPEIMHVKDVDMFFDIDGVCAAIHLCEFIVSVSNVNVHMAGAMGKPVYLLDANKLWYWHNRIGADNLWYPSVKVYPRENMLAPWTKPVERVLEDLKGGKETKTPTFVFFHVGDDVFFPQKLVSSIRASNPGAKIIMCTDDTTPDVLGIDRKHVAPADRSRLMISRLAGFATLGLTEPAIYLDTDMLVQGEVDPLAILADKDAVFCRREFDRDLNINTEINGISLPEYEGKTLDQAYPFIACTTVTRDHKPWVAMLELLSFLDKKFHIWYGDQEAMKLYASVNPERTAGLGEAVYGCLPERIDPAQPPKIVHFKGPSRKKLFEAA